MMTPCFDTGADYSAFADSLLALETWQDRIIGSGLPVVLYGTGKGARKTTALFLRSGIAVSAVCASEGSAALGSSFCGMQVKTYAECAKEFGSFVCVPAFAARGDDIALITEIAQAQTVVMPNPPVAGEGMCGKETLVRLAETAHFVYERLGDGESRRVLYEVLAFGITGDINYLARKCPPRLMTVHPGKRFIDVGAYDGDTALEYARLCPEYGDITAFEPSEANYAKLCRRTEGLRIKCICAAAWEKRGEGSENGNDGRAVSVSEKGSGTELYALDGFGKNVGLIKIDAEGAEREVLYGASNTVAAGGDVCCAVYHRADDIITLPRLMLYYRPDAKIYLRREEYLPAWDVFATITKENNVCTVN
ncbi:MAG TPA: FkbM family methyltransferase [Bacillota bacterium]|nr:FkbM family methyltransferase [Bacillota bacterium]